MAQLFWVKCGQDGHYCDFKTVTPTSKTVEGVYVIWHEGNPGRVVYVGQGIIWDRICQHRKNRDILACEAHGTLLITWAAVPSAHDRDGIERYLADQWSPLVGDAHPDVRPIAVNSPW